MLLHSIHLQKPPLKIKVFLLFKGLLLVIRLTKYCNTGREFLWAYIIPLETNYFWKIDLCIVYYLTV